MYQKFSMRQLLKSIFAWILTASNNISPLNLRQSYMHSNAWGYRGAKSLIALS